MSAVTVKRHANLQKIPVEQFIATRTDGQIKQMCRNVEELHRILEDMKAQIFKECRFRIVNDKTD